MLNVISGTGYYTEQQKIFGVFLFLVQTNLFVTTPRKMAKVSPVRRILWLVFHAVHLESPIKKYAADIYIMLKLHCFFTRIKLDT